jgi:hypothetical protein
MRCTIPPTLTFVLAFSLGVCGCAERRAPLEKKDFEFHVTGDPGQPVAGAEILLSGRRVATTDAQGVAQLALSGREGDAFEAFVRCPSEYQSPAQGIRVGIHRLAGNKRTEYAATCSPRARTIVLAVHGLKGHRLPVMLLGRAIGETDDSGVATIVLHAEPNDQFEVTLDTSAPEDALVRPRNPVATFTTKNEDDVFVFDPQLTLAPRPKPTVARAPVPVRVGPPIPIRIQ